MFPVDVTLYPLNGLRDNFFYSFAFKLKLSLVFLTDSLREKPIQNTMINVEGRILHEEISEFTDAKPIPKLVQFQESTIV